VHPPVPRWQSKNATTRPKGRSHRHGGTLPSPGASPGRSTTRVGRVLRHVWALLLGKPRPGRLGAAPTYVSTHDTRARPHTASLVRIPAEPHLQPRITNAAGSVGSQRQCGPRMATSSGTAH
jgi:hypothetical protein